MELCSIASGSSGNCIFAGGTNTGVLFDAGISGKKIEAGLNGIGRTGREMEAVFITHEHSDHIKGLGVIVRRYGIPVYATEATWRAINKAPGIGEIPEELFHPVCPDRPVSVGELEITPFSVSHDAADPVGYRVYYGAHSVATATDMGYYSHRVHDALSGVDLLVLESNHAIDMLRHNEHYSQTLKNRILGRSGHLCNEACGEALWQLYQTGVRHAVLGHLSHENNTPELALRTVCESLQAHGLEIGKDIRVDMAWRDHVGSVYEID